MLFRCKNSWVYNGLSNTVAIVWLSFVILLRKPGLIVAGRVLNECRLHLQREYEEQKMAVGSSSKDFSMYRRWFSGFLVAGSALCSVKFV